MPRPDNGTRQKLIDTATNLLWTSSYGAVSVDDICRESDVKKGSFYHYFPSKQILAITAMEEYFETYIKPDMDRIFAANVPLLDQINALADAVIKEQQMVKERHGLVCGCPLAALASEMIGEENALIAAKVQEMFDNCKTYLFRAISTAIDTGVIEPQDAREKTEEIHDLITGQLMVARVHNSLDGLERDLKPAMFRVLGLENATEIKSKNIKV